MNATDFYKIGMQRAVDASRTSHDPDTQTGCAIYDQNGWLVARASNRIPFMIPVTKERTTRPEKYNWIEHAERSAIYSENRPELFKNGTMFLNWFPCVDCARAIVAVEIGTLVFIIKQERKADPRYGFETSEAILRAGGVALVNYEEVTK